MFLCCLLEENQKKNQKTTPKNRDKIIKGKIIKSKIIES